MSGEPMSAEQLNEGLASQQAWAVQSLEPWQPELPQEPQAWLPLEEQRDAADQPALPESVC